MYDIMQAVMVTQQNKAQLIASVDRKEKCVRWYQWSSFLSTFFKPIPHITSYHNFHVSADHPGSVFVREYSGSPEFELKLLKQPTTLKLDPSIMPDTMETWGLEETRQRYLYEQIRPFCATTIQEDLTCPLPMIAKPTSDQSEAQPY